MRTTIILLLAAAMLVSFVTPASAEEVGGPCNHTGLLCDYEDCHPTMPECDPSVCEFYFHGHCYYDLPIN
ncbi:MAG: hypothetical protein QOD77_1093 [Thermoplasmata archaeon]|jgi:hypothetical protein|nr:hypothetical protein [Thermoplasmata archaeon]